jgi:hypothetical protein
VSRSDQQEFVKNLLRQRLPRDREIGPWETGIAPGKCGCSARTGFLQQSRHSSTYPALAVNGRESQVQAPSVL